MNGRVALHRYIGGGVPAPLGEAAGGQGAPDPGLVCGEVPGSDPVVGEAGLGELGVVVP